MQRRESVFFYVIGNSVGISYYIKALRAGSHCGRVELCR